MRARPPREITTAEAVMETVLMVERNMCNAVMRGIAVPPGSKSTSRAKGSRRNLGYPTSGRRLRVGGGYRGALRTPSRRVAWSCRGRAFENKRAPVSRGGGPRLQGGRQTTVGRPQTTGNEIVLTSAGRVLPRSPNEPHW
jgi:hypothetical protein